MIGTRLPRAVVYVAFVCAPCGCAAASARPLNLRYSPAEAARGRRAARPQLLASPPKAHAIPAEEWRSVFDALDHDADGALAFDEVAKFMAQIAPDTHDDTASQAS